MTEITYTNKDGFTPADGTTSLDWTDRNGITDDPFNYHKDGKEDGDGYEHGGYPEITGETSEYTDTSYKTGDDPDFFHNGNVWEQPQVNPEPPVPVPELVSIEISTPPTKVEYNEGDALDLSGMVVTAHYDDESEQVVTDYATSPADGTILTDETEVEVAYRGKFATQPITVVPAVVLESIEITTPPTKVEYFEGDALDLSGMVVTGHYSDGSSAEVDYTSTPENGAILTNETQVVVEHEGFTAIQAITVSAITEGIKINDTYYSSVAEALEALAVIDVPATAIIYEDIALGDASLVISEGQDITLRLNGHKITSTRTDSANGTITNNGTLRLIGDVEGSGVVGSKKCIISTGTATIDGGEYTSTNSAFLAMEGGTIEINDADVEAQEFAVLVYKGANAIINGGTFTTADNCVVGTNGTNGWDGNSIVINDGTFNGHIASAGYVACGAYIANNDELVINGGTFNIENGCGILARSGQTTVGPDVVINVSGDMVGKVGDSRVVVPCKELVIDYAAHYPGGEPTLVNETEYEVYTIEPALTSIAITTAPTKTSYYEGDTLDLEGMVVTASYDDGTSRTISDYTTVPDVTEPLVLGTTEFTVSYRDKSATQAISVAEVVLEGIEITTPPTKTSYFDGQTLNLDGMVVTASYNNGHTEEVSGYTTVPAAGTELHVGTTEFTVSYEGEIATQAISVVEVELESIAVTAAPAKTNYFAGDALDLTGLEVTATYSNGETSVLSSSDYSTNPADGATLTNEERVIITYQGKVASQDIVVVAVELVNIEVANPPTKTIYNVGDALDLSGMIIRGNYNNGTSETIPAGDYSTSPVDGATLQRGDNTVTISYEGKTTTQHIAVGSEVKGVALAPPPDKDIYMVGEPVDLSGMKIKITYTDGTSRVVTSGWTSQPAEGVPVTLEDEDTGIHIFYEEDGTTYELVHYITVFPA